jgi:hypothetical protein
MMDLQRRISANFILSQVQNNCSMKLFGLRSGSTHCHIQTIIAFDAEHCKKDLQSLAVLSLFCRQVSDAENINIVSPRL